LCVLMCARQPMPRRRTASSMRVQLASTLARSSTTEGVGTSSSDRPTKRARRGSLGSAAAIVDISGVFLRRGRRTAAPVVLGTRRGERAASDGRRDDELRSRPEPGSFRT